MTKKSQRLGHTNPGQHAWDDFYTELQPHKINTRYRKNIQLSHYITAVLITIALTIITPLGYLLLAIVGTISIIDIIITGWFPHKIPINTTALKHDIILKNRYTTNPYHAIYTLLPHIPLDAARKAVGALGEEKTGDILDGNRHITHAAHGTKIIKRYKNGGTWNKKIVADIDHIVTGTCGTILIDTKMWNNANLCVDHNGHLVDINQPQDSPPRQRSIETIVWEASNLKNPQLLTAIIVCVGLSTQHQPVLTITADNATRFGVTCPIYVVAHDDLNMLINLLAERRHKPHNLAKLLKQSPNIDF